MRQTPLDELESYQNIPTPPSTMVLFADPAVNILFPVAPDALLWVIVMLLPVLLVRMSIFPSTPFAIPLIVMVAEPVIRMFDVPEVESAFSGVEVELFVVEGTAHIAPNTVFALAIPPDETMVPVVVDVLSVVALNVATPAEVILRALVDPSSVLT